MTWHFVMGLGAAVVMAFVIVLAFGQPRQAVAQTDRAVNERLIRLLDNELGIACYVDRYAQANSTAIACVRFR